MASLLPLAVLGVATTALLYLGSGPRTAAPKNGVKNGAKNGAKNGGVVDTGTTVPGEDPIIARARQVLARARADRTSVTPEELGTVLDELRTRGLAPELTLELQDFVGRVGPNAPPRPGDTLPDGTRVPDTTPADVPILRYVYCPEDCLLSLLPPGSAVVDDRQIPKGTPLALLSEPVDYWARVRTARSIAWPFPVPEGTEGWVRSPYIRDVLVPGGPGRLPTLRTSYDPVYEALARRSVLGV